MTSTKNSRIEQKKYTKPMKDLVYFKRIMNPYEFLRPRLNGYKLRPSNVDECNRDDYYYTL